MDPHISKLDRKRKPNYIPSLNLLFFPFFCFTLTHFLPSVSGCPVHTFPSLLILCQICPCRPSLHVPTLSNINSLTMHTNYTHYWGEGLKKRGGESTCFCACLDSFSGRGNKKQRGFGWLSNLVSHSNGEPHYCTPVSIDSCSHCCGINSVHEWAQTQGSSAIRISPPLTKLNIFSAELYESKATAKLHA